jgi:Tol biopolymer transport system component
MIGQRVAHYNITAHLGSGGMGDVYQATDTRLGRSVALKFLPDAFAHDPGRASRFEREAKALASLNHPNIAALHGLEESDGRGFLVMELVPGQTLDERILGPAMPLEETLSVARQIADALEAAHEKGIVHRDLKPANVKVTPDGRVKVLDFGLAKLVTDDADERARRAAVSKSPTIIMQATHAGVILGTAAYMAPEQAKGLAVDTRADIFAFGCVLYEMLTGRPAFDGETTTDILSRVLQRDPDWTQLPSDVPPSIHRLVRLCLEKDPRKRRQAAGDVRLDLEHALTEPVVAPIAVARRRGRVIPFAWAAVALLVVAALALPAVRHLREAPPPEMRLQIVTPPALDPLDFALSPDGRYLVFVATGSSSDAERLYLRAMNQTEARPLAGTAGARFPFWSPDSRSLGFFASEQVFRIDIAGGPAQPLAPAVNPQGGAWSGDGTIVFAPTTVTPLFRVPASGGKLTAATALESPSQTNHRRPFFLPLTRQFLFHATGPGQSAVYLGSLDTTMLKRVMPTNSSAQMLAPDHIVFAEQGALVARRFEASRGEVTGDPVTIADVSGIGSGAALGFSTSAAGSVAYRAAKATPSRMTWFDRAGSVLSQGADLNAPNISPNGRYVVYDRTIEGNRDVWIMDLVRGGTTRFTTNAAIDGFPVWSPDGSRLAFHSQRKGTFDIWTKRFDGAAGTEELLLETPDHEWPIAWSKDGRFLLYQRTDRDYESSNLFALPMTGADRTPIVVADTPAEERMGEFSPDSRWIAYQTSESGQPEIVVRGFPESKAIVHVSTSGGTAPRWRADGKEIYFVALDGKMMAVRVTTTGQTITLGTPEPLFSTHITSQVFTYQYAVASDGRFLIHNRQLADASPITVLLNWKP